MVPEDEALNLSSELNNIVSHYVPHDPNRELHGYEIFGKKKRWEDISIETAKNVYRDSLAVLGQTKCVIAHSSINKAALAAREKGEAPHFVALNFLIDKIEDYLLRQKEPLLSRALLVADETNEHEAYSITMLQSMQRGEGGVYRGRKITRIVDTVHFVKSETNRGVQIADLVIFALSRRARKKQSVSQGDAFIEDLVSEYILPNVKTSRGTWPT